MVGEAELIGRILRARLIEPQRLQAMVAYARSQGTPLHVALQRTLPAAQLQALLHPTAMGETRPGPPPSGPAPSVTAPTTADGDAPASPPIDPKAFPRPMGVYELLGELGKGGMGVVYKARHTGLDRLCAVKVLIAGQDASQELAARFVAEARTAAKLDSHPHIVRVLDANTIGNRAYMAMEYVEGTTLRDLIDRDRVGPKNAARVVGEIASALAFAHERGVIHRDVKPDNILIDREGTARLTDFGVAKAGGESGNMTATGAVVGTLCYMAPEQAEDASRVDARSDVYGLGAVLYAFLTGRPPHVGQSSINVLHSLMAKEPPAPRELNPEADPALEAICLRAIAKDPEARTPTASALLAELTEYRKGRSSDLAKVPASASAPAFPPAEPSASPAGTPKTSWLPVAVGSVIALLGLGLAGALVASSDSKHDPVASGSQGDGAGDGNHGTDSTGTTGADSTGAIDTDPSGTDSTDADTTSTDSTSTDSTDADSTDADSTDADSTGADSTGEDSTGADSTDASDTDSTRPNADPFDLDSDSDSDATPPGSSDPLALLRDREAWSAAGESDAGRTRQQAAVDEVARRLGPRYALLRVERFACNGLAHRVAVFRHEPTGVELNLIPGGAFRMGLLRPLQEEVAWWKEHHPQIPDAANPKYLRRSLPVRRIAIDRPFLIGRLELRQDEWERVLPAPRSWKRPVPTNAVDCVAWAEAHAWTATAGDGLRLPSEAEWEYACRAGTTSRFFWGDAFDPDYAWTLSSRPTPPRPNAFGLIDMPGSMYEWCADQYAGDLSAGPTTQRPFDVGNGNARVVRGASYRYGLHSTRVDVRGGDAPYEPFQAFGFRVAVTVPSESEPPLTTNAPALTLGVEAPGLLAFEAGVRARVRGRVHPPSAKVRIGEQLVTVAPDGRFAHEHPLTPSATTAIRIEAETADTRRETLRFVHQDARPPRVRLAEPRSDSLVAGREIELHLTFNEVATSVRIGERDHHLGRSKSWKGPVTLPSAGPLEVAATDRAGNVGRLSLEVRPSADSAEEELPTLQLDPLPAATRSKSTITGRLQSASPATLRLNGKRVTVRDGAFSVKVDTALLLKGLTLEATDAEGRTTARSVRLPLTALLDREQWNAAPRLTRELEADEVERRLGKAYQLDKVRSYACNGVENYVAVFKHRKTGMYLHLLPGGTFTMGTTQSERDAELAFWRTQDPKDRVNLEVLDRELPAREILVRPFLIGRCEVLRREWRAQAKGYPGRSKGSLTHPLNALRPSSMIRWLTNVGDGFKLATEVEWEYACRAGTRTRYFWGDTFDPSYAWCAARKANTHQSGVFHYSRKKYNAFGLVDMVGNLSEIVGDGWCEDHSGARLDQTRREGKKTSRVRRGGAYNVVPFGARPAVRGAVSLEGVDEKVGFRVCVRVPGINVRSE